MRGTRARSRSCRSLTRGWARRSTIACAAPPSGGTEGHKAKKMNIAKSSAPPLSLELIEKFRKIVGDRYALTEASDIAPYVTEERDLFHGRSPLVLRPASTEQVAAICKLATE